MIYFIARLIVFILKAYLLILVGVGILWLIDAIIDGDK